MLAALTVRVSERTSVLDRFLTLCDACDVAAGNPGGALHAELSERSILASNPTYEKIFRHCAIITELYAIYEAFSEATLGFWLTRLPRYKVFADLPQAFQNAYSRGMARIIQDKDKHKFRNLGLVDVVAKYLSSLRGESPWELVAEALTTHDRNLRRSEFEQMFHSAGLEGVWGFLERNPTLASHTIKGDANRSLERMILELVTYRNDASHGSPDEILGIGALRERIAFIKAFCKALEDFLTDRIVREEVSYRPDSVFGTVTETFRNNIAVITCNKGSLRVGDYYFFLRESDCIRAKIESINVNDIDKHLVEITYAGFEVGIKTSENISRGSLVVKIDDFW